MNNTENIGLGLLSDLEIVVDEKARLAEGPCWNSETQTLCWVDIEGEKVHVYDPASRLNKGYDVGELIGCAVPCQSGKMLLGLKKRLALLSLETGQITDFVALEDHQNSTRINDGKCDVKGEFWFGTMNMASEEALGGFYRLDTSLIAVSLTAVSLSALSLSAVSISKVPAIDATISNGFVWSIDQTLFYYIDSPTRCVKAFDYDFQTKEIKDPKVIIRFFDGDGVPDGMTQDTEGMLWIAHWGGGKITRWNPRTGACLGTLRLPVSNVTSCTFGGSELDELYITTAREGLSDEQLELEPYAGGVFRIKVKSKGFISKPVNYI